MNKNNTRLVSVQRASIGFKITFNAMASSCEVLLETLDKTLATDVGNQIANEAWRIEDKYSRYKKNSVCTFINNNSGKVSPIDSETYRLLSFAEQCFKMSDGMFDITSGILRNAWHFDGSANVPSVQDIKQLLPYIGWQKVTLTQNAISMLPNMEIDLGGLGKEYAVDTCIQIVEQATNAPALINFGGDIATTGPRLNHLHWSVGIEQPGRTADKAVIASLKKGAIATSGDEKRFLLKNGKRFGHVLNPKTGWPVENAPKSVTINAPNCIQAGFIATLALLQGKHATDFLTEQGITHWCIW